MRCQPGLRRRNPGANWNAPRRAYTKALTICSATGRGAASNRALAGMISALPASWIRRKAPAAERLGPIAAVRASDADDDFASCVSLLKVPDGVSHLTQGVARIDDRHDVAGFEQLFHTCEIRAAWSCQEVAHLLRPGH